MTTLRFVPDAGAVPPPEPDIVVVVLDTTWTASPGGRADVLGLRSFVGPVLERVDLFADALRRVDGWAADGELPARLAIGGFSAWYGMREELWYWLHERILWRLVIADLVASTGADRLEVRTNDQALVDVATALRATGLGVDLEAHADAHAPAATKATAVSTSPPGAAPRRSLAGRVRRRLARLLGGSPSPSASARPPSQARVVADRLALLERRIAAIVAQPGLRTLVLSYTTVHQRIGGRRMDPFLGPVIDRLRSEGPAPVVFGLGLSHADDDTWPDIEADTRLLPASLLHARWGRAEAPVPDAAPLLDAAFELAAGTRLDVDGADLGPAIAAKARAHADAWLPTALTGRPRIARLLAELQPDAMLLTHEGIRAPWLVAARAARVPILAVQHGILYPSHPGYCHPRDETLVLPDRTLVAGEYELGVLLGSGAYHPGEVVVTGATRGDSGPPVDAEADRAAVRAELGVASDDRLLVVSTAHVPLFRRYHYPHVFQRTLGGPLPGVHVVFKQHPGETDEGPYRRLLEGMAGAGGYEAPPISVVREIDLYRLLRAADAHLGYQSTVLTDAVVAGTPNLIAIVGAFRDPVGWVAAGVARPVTSVEDVRGALANPEPPTEAARDAFLAAHFSGGDASSRIVAAIRGVA